jgi:hypothetical protein
VICRYSIHTRVPLGSTGSVADFERDINRSEHVTICGVVEGIILKCLNKGKQDLALVIICKVLGFEIVGQAENQRQRSSIRRN